MPRGLGDGQKDAPNSQAMITASGRPVASKIVAAIQIGAAQR
jgi:hypothetical protein